MSPFLIPIAPDSFHMGGPSAVKRARGPVVIRDPTRVVVVLGVLSLGATPSTPDAHDGRTTLPESCHLTSSLGQDPPKNSAVDKFNRTGPPSQTTSRGGIAGKITEVRWGGWKEAAQDPNCGSIPPHTPNNVPPLIFYEVRTSGPPRKSN